MSLRGPSSRDQTELLLVLRLLSVQCGLPDRQSLVTKVSDLRILTFKFGDPWPSKTETRESLVTRLICLAPKNRFPKGLMPFPADVWTFSCTTYEILDKWALFGNPLGDGDDRVIEMGCCLRILPQQ